MSRAEGSSEPPVPRTVKPRRLQVQHRPVLAVDLEAGLALAEDGRLIALDDLAAFLVGEPSSFIVTMNAAALVNRLHRELEHVPNWQYRLTPIKRGIQHVNGQVKRTQIQGTVVNFFGWRKSGKQAGLYHYPVDPFTFCGARGVVNLLPEARGTWYNPVTGEVLERLPRLLAWGQDIRAWCESQELRVSPTNGGLAAQLLRDPRFWPEARRKVPRPTNARVRPRLPGNYYRLFAPEHETFQAYYLDMSSAHHTIASSLQFPHPDTLRARGHFKTVPGETDVTVPQGLPWASVGSRSYNRVLASHGLLYVHLTVPKLLDTQFPPPYMVHPGTKMAWIFTNELATIRTLGGVIDWITAAWTSWNPDPGMNAYAQWALQETAAARDQDRARWLKPTLLATYGLLAARPRVMETAYRLATGGVPRRYPAGPGMLPATARITDTEQETPVVNVLYRGLIEAEQRVRALACARHLHAHGARVLAIYADSVFVESGTPLPFLPDGWRVEAELDALQFLSSTAFTSRQVTKLPGLPRDSLERVRRIEQVRAFNTS